MTHTPAASDGDSRERLIRVEERLKHMDETHGRALRDLKTAISDLASASKGELIEIRSRIATLEKRVDKVYWVWSAAVFLGTPLMVALTKIVFARFGM